MLPVSCLLLVVKLTHTESRLNSLVTLRLGRAQRCHMSAGGGQLLIGPFGKGGQLYRRVSPHQTPFQPVALTTVSQQLIGVD